MEFKIGPTGNLIQGTIFDTPKEELERKLKRYDEQLYLKWEPKRNRGYGCWQLRRRPQFKTIVDSFRVDGCIINRLEYKEIDIENHVWDINVLTESLLDRVKACDIWDRVEYQEGRIGRIEQFNQDMEENYFGHRADTQEKTRKEMMYGIMQDKRIVKDFQERIVSGVNPAHLLRYWK